MWEPDTPFDLVATHYAHPATSQLAFYGRKAQWVAPGGTLVVVGHLHTPGRHQHGEMPPAEASVTAASITALLDAGVWTIDQAGELARVVTTPGGRQVVLNDVVVRATRR